MKRTFAVCAMLALAGCVTEPKLEATKPWEGHCYTIESLKSKTDQIEALDEGESIWIMSNHTLNRLLKNASGK